MGEPAPVSGWLIIAEGPLEVGAEVLVVPVPPPAWPVGPVYVIGGAVEDRGVLIPLIGEEPATWPTVPGADAGL